MKISDAELGMIGAQQVRWPSADTNIAWRHLHEAVTAIREEVRGADLAIAEKEADRDLSDVGRLKVIGAIGIAFIGTLKRLPEIGRAEASAHRMVEHFAKGASMPGAPTEMVDVMLAQEIRAHIASQREPANYVLKHKSDARFVAAVAHAPSYLSGLKDEEKNLFLREAETAMFPGASGDKRELLKAQDQLQSIIRHAEKVIGERAQLMKTQDGWDIKSGPARAA